VPDLSAAILIFCDISRLPFISPPPQAEVERKKKRKSQMSLVATFGIARVKILLA